MNRSQTRGALRTIAHAEAFLLIDVKARETYLERLENRFRQAPSRWPGGPFTHPKKVPMKSSRCVAHLSHQSAEVIEWDADTMQVMKTERHHHATRQHGSEVRAQHEFFASVCDLLDRFAQVLVMGGHTTLSDFRHYVEKHRAQTATRIVGYDVVDQPTENQLVAQAHKRFDALERLA